MNSEEAFLSQSLLNIHLAETQVSNRYALSYPIKSKKQGWLAQRSCWVLHQLGHFLVAAGRWLQRYGLPRSVPFEGTARQGG
jgi:hypothetical protein